MAELPRTGNPSSGPMPLDPTIYCAGNGFDFDLALLVEALKLLDSQLGRIANQVDPDGEDHSSAYRRSEHIIGLGFVACQTYLHARSGLAALKKTETLDRGPRHPCGLPITGVINAAAN